MADGIQIASGQTVATREIGQYNGGSVATPRHLELAGLAFDLGGGAAAAVGRGTQTRALSLPVAIASDDLLLQRLPAQLGDAGELLVGAVAPSQVFPFISSGAPIQQLLKAGVATFLGLEFYKATAGTYWVKLYDKASTPSAADTPKSRHKVTDTMPASIRLEPGDLYANGVGIRIVGGAADSDNTGVALNEAQGQARLL